MQIVSKKTLEAFWAKHPDSEMALKAWHYEASKAKWTCPQDIKDAHASASFVADNRVVFNIKGNNYRLIVRLSYLFKSVTIKFIGTHAEYDKIDANTVELEK